MALNKYKLSRKLRAHARQIMYLAMIMEKQPIPSDERIIKLLKLNQKHFNETVDMEITVYCAKCKQSVKEKDVEFINIEEDIQGRDKLTFKCHICDTVQVSWRRG